MNGLKKLLTSMKFFSITTKFLVILFLTATFLSACSQGIEFQPTITFIVEDPATPVPTEAIQPTAQIGLEESPIIIGYSIIGNPADYEIRAEKMISALEERTSYQISFVAYNNPQTAFDDLRLGNVHFFFIQPLTYLAATERDLVVPLLVSNHFGSYNYGTQFFANKDSFFNTYFDTKTNKSTTTADFALQQFEGKRPCWTEPSSLSGAIIPFGILAQNGISFLPAAYLQNPSSVIRALYIKGICDFGATYAYSGDPRTSSQVINDLPNVLNQIDIIWQSEAIIPSLGFAASSTVPIQIQNDIRSAFLTLISSDDGKSIVTDALEYDVQGFISIEDDYYDQLRKLVEAANINPYQHLGY
jgi:phosphonate transport system substrate-binding protein